MSTQHPDDATTSRPRSSPGASVFEERSGWVTFAAIMLVILGALNTIYGIAAIDKASFFVEDQKFIISDLKTWGWITLVIGVAQLLAAVSLWGGGLYGRVVGIATASVSAIAALLSIPGYPFWSLAVFALDVIVIHQIATRGTAGRGANDTLTGR